jgi:importin-5
MEPLLRAFLSPDNGIRREAVRALEVLQTQKDDLPLGLLQVTRTSGAPELRMLAAVLLRKVVNTEDAGGVARWTRVDAAAQSAICEQLLLAVQHETEDFVRRRICDTLAEVAMHVMADAPWPKFWLAIYALVSSPAFPLQEAGLLLCEMLGGYIAGSMSEHLPTFRNMYHQRLSDAAAPRRVRAAAARAVGTILISLTSKSTSADTFAALIPDLVRCLLEAQAARDTEAAMTFVGVVVDVADKQAQLFKPCLGDVVRALCGLASDASGDNDVRRVSLEALLCIGENAPSIARKGMPSGGFLAAVLPVALHMMLEHGSVGSLTDAQWDALDGRLDGGEDAGDDSSNVNVGEEAVERLGQGIGAEHLMRAIGPMIAAALATPAAPDGSEWRYYVAGLSALAQVNARVLRFSFRIASHRTLCLPQSQVQTAEMLPDDDAATHTALISQVGFT